ncbi:competence type IV pilus minor pilin ComGE [Streptococcus respiraculi]|uniref:competence type IV pilus minor pilin ComGE n=1 Tax=Streptococcus respiraculi TaxID=2021971 RepID=UPI000E71C4E0
MGTIKRQKNKAYILLESLVALAIFSMITSLLLTGVLHSRKWQEKQWQKQEVLLLAKMAIQSRQERLTLNGNIVTVQRGSRYIRVYYQGEEVLNIEKE